MKKVLLGVFVLILLLKSGSVVLADEEKKLNKPVLNRLLENGGQKIKEKVRNNFPKAAIGSGKLTVINGTTLTIEKDGKTYTVSTGSFEKCTTKFRRRFWGDSGISEMTVGNILNITGRFTNDEKTTIEACLIRNISIQKRRGVFVGVILSLTDNGFVMTTVSEKRENQTVVLNSSTKLVNRKEQSVSKSDLAVGHKVRVKGLWDRSTNTLTEVTQVKVFSLPKVSLTPTP